jgi:hypothetical protein
MFGYFELSGTPQVQYFRQHFRMGKLLGLDGSNHIAEGNGGHTHYGLRNPIQVGR